ncbi:MAG: hypothetical protein HY378_00805 [Candidatus Brennerbacteria bacterium]|nr:hypothetical protein [Candidatus Brennerbacteria bacterium]
MSGNGGAATRQEKRKQEQEWRRETAEKVADGLKPFVLLASSSPAELYDSRQYVLEAAQPAMGLGGRGKELFGELKRAKRDGFARAYWSLVGWLNSYLLSAAHARRVQASSHPQPSLHPQPPLTAA